MYNIVFKEITKNNFIKVIELTILKEQDGFVAPNIFSIAQSKVEPTLTPYAIYDNEILIGFTLYGIDTDDNNFWIMRFMIDKNFQGKGYGKKAFNEILEKIKKETDKKEIYLSCNINNNIAQKMYEEFGFVFQNKVIHGENVFKLNI